MRKVVLIACCIMAACTKEKTAVVKIDGKTYTQNEFAIYKNVNSKIGEVIVTSDSTGINLCITDGDNSVVGFYSEVYNFFPLDSNNIKDIIYKIRKDTSFVSKMAERSLMERLYQERETFPVTLREYY